MAIDQPPPPAGSGAVSPEPDPWAEVTPQPAAPAPDRNIGAYAIERELGRGGMGAVYLARNGATGERVALKELLVTQAADPVAVRRFLQEGAVMARMTHPNIVGVRDIVDSGAGHYIALEFIDGGSLRDLLKRGPLPTPQAFAVMHGLLQALDYAHQHGIVHRDVKPENVMISSRGEVKVADFGIARLTDDSATSHATKTGTTVGTPQYMSPEQVTTSKVDGRSDLYSAGIVCYEVFCGKPPFEASETDGPFTLFAKHVQAPPPPPSVRRPGLDPQLERVILHSLAKRPEDRFQTGAEFDAALAAIADRLCSPNWQHALEPGAMTTEKTMVLAAMPRPAAVAAPAPAAPPAAAPPVAVVADAARAAYAPKPPGAGVPASRRSNRVGLLVAAAAALIVVVGGTAAVFALTRPPARGSTPEPTPSAPAARACDWLKPGGPVAAGATGSCGVTLGAALVDDDLTGRSALPADLKGYQLPGANGAVLGAPATIAVAGSGATVPAAKSGVGTAIATAAPATDSVVVVDFTPASDADSDIGVCVRCSTSGGVVVFVSPKQQKIWIMEGAPGGTGLKQLFSDQAAVTVGQAARLVVAVKGVQVQAWLDGNLVGSVQTAVITPGLALFSVVDADPAKPAGATLAGIHVFAT